MMTQNQMTAMSKDDLMIQMNKMIVTLPKDQRMKLMDKIMMTSSSLD